MGIAARDRGKQAHMLADVASTVGSRSRNRATSASPGLSQRSGHVQVRIGGRLVRGPIDRLVRADLQHGHLTGDGYVDLVCRGGTTGSGGGRNGPTVTAAHV